MPYAPLRHLDAIGIEHEGEEKMLLRDPEHLCTEALAVPMPLFFIASLMNGRRDAREIQEIISQVSEGQLIPLDFIDRVAQEFDRCLLLDNERSAAARAQLEAEYEAAPHRAAALAGSAYPEDPDELRAMLDGFYVEAGAETPSDDFPAAFIAPHIDLRVGGPSYARVYARLPAGRPADLYIILGVAHQSARNMFTLGDKDYETPLGRVAVDRDAAAMLRELYGAERLEGQYVHKHEHSVEFQTIFLKHRHGGAPFKILPILCGSLHEAVGPDAAGAARDCAPAVGEFIDALKKLLAARRGRVCVIASVDLSHVGLKFGDAKGIDPMRMQLTETADRRMLERAAARDAEGFIAHFREDANARNVDAVCAVYAMLHALESESGAAGEIVDYRQWHETDTDSMVTFASVIYPRA